jgi:hypothetical protein
MSVKLPRHIIPSIRFAATAGRAVRRWSPSMLDVLLEKWNGCTIGLMTVPVRQLEVWESESDGYLAIVRIDCNGEVLADWHVPRSAAPRISAAEAQRESLEYAIRVLGSGMLTQKAPKG